ncbi:MAG: hypothetical protein LIO53_03155 [Oscillospiraceae bacterium]|nr:hypothetical protein [Oscillospiraceae bacterium]
MKKLRKFLALITATAMLTAGAAIPAFAEVDDEQAETAAVTLFAEETGSSTVATIGDAEYTDLASAFSAAADGDTVTLADDVTLNSSLVLSLSSKSVTLDLNDKTITFAYSEGTFGGATLSDGAWGLKVTSGTLTIEDTAGNGGITATDENTYVDVVGASTDGTLNILGGTYSTNSIYEAVVFGAGNAVINIYGGTFTNSATSYKYNSTYTNGLVLNIGNSSTATINVKGGTFTGYSPVNGDDNVDTGSFVASGYTYTDGTVSADTAVATVDGVGYATLEDALAAASDGTTVLQSRLL